MNPIITNMAITGATVTAAQIARGNMPTLRPIIGITLAGVVLLAAAETTPGAERLARQFSTLVMVTALLTSGGIVAGALTRYFTRIG